MEAKNIRIGNVTSEGIVKAFWEHGVYIGLNKRIKFEDLQEVTLTEDWLKKLGFTAVETNRYINGKQYLMQITDDYVDEEAGDIISRDGTWFDGIGTYSFKKNGAMVVNVLCKGNYVCNSVGTVHELQNLFFALTGTDFKIKD